MRAVATLGAATRACVVRWRASLVVLVLVAVPLMAPFVLIQAVSALTLRGGMGDPILMQHLTWFMGSPETASLGFGLWLLFFGPWAIGIWGASGARLRLWIGWEPYARYLVVLCCVALVTVLDGVLGAFVAIGFGVHLALEVLADAVALYVFLRLAGTGPVVRDGGLLDLRGAWRASAAHRTALITLTVLWVVLGAALSVLAEVLALVASQALVTLDIGASALSRFVVLGAPGVITGGTAALIVLGSIALFWTVAKEASA